MAAITPEGTKIYLYMTWSEKSNPAGQAAMSAAYEALAEKIDATICPVGRIWWQTAAAHPDEELYFADGEHSSVLGASLGSSGYRAHAAGHGGHAGGLLCRCQELGKDAA